MVRKFTNIQEKEICKQYIENRLSSIVLAEKWECAFSTIIFILRKRGYRIRNLSEAQKGKRVGVDNSFYGKHHSEATKQKIREKMKGRKAWSKGLTKETDERLRSISKKLEKRTLSEETKRKLRNSHKGCIPWNKGKKSGAPSEKTKKKISIANKGQKAWNKGLTKKTDVRVKKMSEKALLRVQNNLGPYKDTKPELKMKEILRELNIPFEHQFRLGKHNFDFHILNTNILIEVDGDYWHGNPKKFSKLNKIQQKQKQKDKKYNKIAKENNFILLRFWESNILNNTEKIENKILKNII